MWQVSKPMVWPTCLILQSPFSERPQPPGLPRAQVGRRKALHGASSEHGGVARPRKGDCSTNYYAKVRLIAGSRLAEYTFASLPPPKTGDPEQAYRIRMRSRLSFGRSRQQVEEALRSRGTFSLPSRGKYDE